MMMQNVLSRASRDVIEQFAWSNAVLALDYDGTLAPIVSDPDDAFMRPATRELLERAAELYPTIVISGRAQADVAKHLHGIRVSAVIGNHGLEPWRGGDELVRQVRRWVPILEGQLSRFKGVRIEDKTYSLAIHYRHSREKKVARPAILRAATLLGSVRIIGGKQVVNVLPEGAPHKGVALERERTRLRCDTAVYVGDDETDEDVFTLDQPGRLLTIRVGAKRSSAASYFVAGQAQVDDLLRALVEQRLKLDRGRLAAR